MAKNKKTLTKAPRGARKLQNPKPLAPAARRKFAVKKLPGDLPPLPQSLSNLDQAAYHKPLCIASTMSAQQQQIAECGAALKKLMANGELTNVLVTMTALRQAYAVVYHELGRMVAEAEAKALQEGQPLPVGVLDFAAQYAMYSATKAFNEHSVMQAFIVAVLPCLTEIIDRHTAQDEADSDKSRADAEIHRRARSVPIDLATIPQQDTRNLLKPRSLVLVGWQPAVTFLLDRVVQTLAKAKDESERPFTTVFFADRNVVKGEQTAQTVVVGASKWEGCANGDNNLALCMGENVADILSDQPDVVVVENLPRAYTKNFVGRAEAAAAGDAHRRFRKWCDAAGCGFIGSVPMDTAEPADITAPEFEQLRTFTDLRPVTVTPTDAGFVLSIGGADEILMTQDDIAKHTRSAVLQPKTLIV